MVRTTKQAKEETRKQNSEGAWSVSFFSCYFVFIFVLCLPFLLMSLLLLGGFLTSLTASAGSGAFHNIITVAPVTSWALYDSVYTERYMLRPVDNPNGYQQTSVIAQASPQFDADSWH